jgi:hypothetical protein
VHLRIELRSQQNGTEYKRRLVVLAVELTRWRS